MTDARHLRLAWGGATDQGRVRAVNQDAMYADRGLFVVADGMGGHQGGEVAANLAVRTLAAEAHDTCAALTAAVVTANQTVHEASIARPELHGMGTTLTAIAVVTDDRGPHFGLVNVGDSRIYRQRDGTLHQLTYDHSYVAELMRRGDINAEEAATHPYRNMLTRAIGVNAEVEVDEWEVEPEAGDRYVLCSDGLTNEVSDAEINAVLKKNPGVSDAARALVQLANLNGGRDNSTVLIVDVHIDADERAVPAGIVDTDELDTTRAMDQIDPAADPVDAQAEDHETVVDDLDESAAHEDLGDLAESSPLLAHLAARQAGTEPTDTASPQSGETTDVGAELPPTEELDTVEPDTVEPEPTDGEEPEPEPTDERSDETGPAADPEEPDAVEEESEAPPAPVMGEPESGPRPMVVHDEPTIEQPAVDDPAWIDDTVPAAPRESNWMRQHVSVTTRAIAIPLGIIAAIVSAVSVIGWYARSGYHVGTLGDEVVVYKGRPGGWLWFDPTLESRPGVLLIELTGEDQELVLAGHESESRAGAEAFISDLRTRTVIPDEDGATADADDPANEGSGS